jgi:cysteinyl-tRNA synthetase
MAIKIHNTKTGQKEEFIPRKPGEVSIYVCGVTPYNYCHIGNARPYVVFDVIRRFLVSQGLKVEMIQNFTDIDDKIIAQSNKEGFPWQQIPGRYIPAYFEDMDALGVQRADRYPLVTEHITEIVDLVERLEKNGYAYAIGGDVYFRVKQFKNYGRLSNRSPEEMLSGARVEIDERKEDPLDFALWKSAKEGEPSWPSPWGPGRPGWHIECSAMALKYLGMGFDIHGGGADLVFPHHENEVAQAEAATGKSPFVRYWVHNGWITMDSEKMSKSLGNIRTIKEVRAHWPAEVVRFFLLNVHYRSPLDFTESALEAAKAALERIQVGWERLQRLTTQAATEGPLSPALQPLLALIEAAPARFEEAMEDDFNTAAALAVVFELVREVHRATGKIDYQPTTGDKTILQQALDTLVRLTGILGLLEKPKEKSDDLTDALLCLLVEVRNQARKARNFELADLVRTRLGELNIVLEDNPEGTTWRQR